MYNEIDEQNLGYTIKKMETKEEQELIRKITEELSKLSEEEMKELIIVAIEEAVKQIDETIKKIVANACQGY